MASPSPAIPTTPLTHAPVNVKLVRRDLLYPDTDQPRKFFDAGELQELAESMRPPVGIVNAIVVHPADADGRFKIITGERRWRAAGLIGYVDVPVSIRTAAAKEVALAQLVENHQRANVHPLEEAEAIDRVKKLDRAATNKSIASAIGMSERYVQNVLHYAVLSPKAKDAFRKNEINAGHADLIARLTPADQDRALKTCFDHLYGEDKENGVISVRQLKSWIEDNIRLDLTKDAPELQTFPELDKLITAATDEKPLLLLQVSSHYNDAKTPKGVLDRSLYRTVQKSDRCKFTERAVVVIGQNRGHFIDICRASTTCAKHYHHIVKPAKPGKATKSKKASPQVEAAEKKRQELQAAAIVRAKLRDAVIAAGVKAFDKRAPKSVPFSAAALALLLFKSGSRTLRDLLADHVAEHVAYDIFNDKDYQEAARLLKPFGVDLLAIEKELAPAPKPAKSLGVKRAEKSVTRAQARLANKKKPARKAGAKK